MIALAVLTLVLPSFTSTPGPQFSPNQLAFAAIASLALYGMFVSSNRFQTSLNLALGSAMASLGLTIPAIAVATLFIDGPLLLGLGPTQIVLLVLTVLVSILTLSPGRATRLQGGVHLVLFGAFIFLSISP